MLPPESTDHELLAAWALGDKAAGAALFERHFDALYRFFRNKAGSDDFEDLLQKTFLGCLEARERFRGESTFRTFLFQVARFQLYAHYRERKRVELRELATTSLRDLGTSPTGVLARGDEQRLLLFALRALPLDLQIAVELRYWEGLTEEDVAAVIEVPRGTVASRMRRAHALLRAAIHEEAGSVQLACDTIDNIDGWAASLRELLAGSAKG